MGEEKKDKRLTILIILQGITIIALIGLGIFVLLNSKKPPASVTASIPNKVLVEEEKKEKMNEEIIYDLDPFIVNLMDNGGRRYLKIKMNLVLSSKEVEKEIEKKAPEIRDIIIMTLSEKTFNDIATLEGKMRLRDQLKENMNKVLMSGKVLKIYFTEFVIQ